MSQGYIYVVDPHIQVQGRSVVKIGLTTRSPATRLKELQTSVPHAVSLIHVAQFPNVKWAEKRLHDALASRNVQASGGTEFFFLSATEAVAIVNGLAYQVGVYEAQESVEARFESISSKDFKSIS